MGIPYIDPEYGKIIVKGPAFENDAGKNYTYTKGQKHFYDTPERIFLHKKITPVSHVIDNAVKKIHPNLTKAEITAITQEFIGIFQTLKGFRKIFYVDGYNETMLSLYAKKIRDAQRAIKYDFWDYLVKIKGEPAYEQLSKEVKFSSQILDNLELYKTE
ncbi:TPA: hypothetical protein ACK3JW_000896 [Mannheimia haemolytica]